MTAPSDATAAALPLKCAACNAELRLALVCDQCRTLQATDGTGWFELLGLPVRFDLEPDAIDAAYFRAARLAHPDRSAAAGGAAVHASAALNQAYETLRSPRLRAEYLLERSGGRSAAEDKSVPPDVLAAAMELREELDAALTAHDAEALRRIAQQARAASERHESSAFSAARRLPGDEGMRAQMRADLNALKYCEKLLEQLEASA